MGELRPGTVIAGKYRLERPISKGGMGSVWLADHMQLEAPVAVKFMRGSLVTDTIARSRFEREAKAAAQLRSPYVVHVYDHGLHEGSPYIVMEYLEGSDLRGHLRGRRSLPPGEAARICDQICKGLERAHNAGIVHRDLKPGNIFLSEPDDGMVKILDFGIAKETGSSRVVQGETTTTGQLLGSPHYMSPEQARGKDLDGRSDLWSVAVILFRTLTGHRPFDGDDIGDLIVRICTDAVPPATRFRPELGPEVDAFFARAFERDVERRFPDARTFAEAFRAALEAKLGPHVSGAWDRISQATGPVPIGGHTGLVGHDGLVGDTGPTGSPISSSSERMAAVLRPGPDTLDTLAATTAPSRSRAAWVGGAAALLAVVAGVGAVIATSTSGSSAVEPAAARGAAVDGAAPTAEAIPEPAPEDPEVEAPEAAAPEPVAEDPEPVASSTGKGAVPAPRPRVPRPVRPRPLPHPPPPPEPDLGY